MNERVRAGDQQPPQRHLFVAKGREAAKIMHEFDAAMKSISRDVGASPEELTTLESRVLEMGKRRDDHSTSSSS
jgi:hypothetical protein